MGVPLIFLGKYQTGQSTDVELVTKSFVCKYYVTYRKKNTLDTLIFTY